MQFSTIKISLALLTTLVLWASSLIGIRIALESFDPGALALLRYLVASVCMLFFFYFKQDKFHKPNFTEFSQIFLAGIIGFSLYNVFLNQGETTVDPGSAGFIISQIPVAIVILAMIFLREKLNFVGWLGIVISISGIILVTMSNMASEVPSVSSTGSAGISFHAKLDINMIYLLLATLCHGIYTIMHKPLLRKFNPIEFTAYAMWGGTIALLFYTPALCHEIFIASWSAIFAAIYIGIFPAAIGYLTWSYTLNYLPASKAGAILYVQPLVTTLLSWLILNELPTYLGLIGGTIALVGAIIVSQSHKIKGSHTARSDQTRIV